VGLWLLLLLRLHGLQLALERRRLGLLAVLVPPTVLASVVTMVERFFIVMYLETNIDIPMIIVFAFFLLYNPWMVQR